MSKGGKRLKVRIDGELKELEVVDFNSVHGILRLIEYRYLFPERSIKHIEKGGEVLHPAKVEELKDLSGVNIVTEPSVNMVRKQMEVAVATLDAMLATMKGMVERWSPDQEATRLFLHSVLDSLDWTVKMVETSSRILPLYDGVDEAIANLEGAILRLDDLMYEGKEEEALELLATEFTRAVQEWKEFISGMIRFIKRAPRGIH
jgi:hypothetical protein